MIRSLAVVLLVAASGCLLPSQSDDSNGTISPGSGSTQCIGHVCLEHPDTHDSRYALEHFGFHKLTQDGGRILRPQVHDDLLVWQTMETVDEPETSKLNSDLLAYSFEDERLMEVARSPVYLYKIPFLYDGRVVFSVHPLEGAPEHGETTSWVALWDRETNTTRRLDLGLTAQKQESRGFDGEWGLVAATGTANESEIGLWAYHVDESRRQFIYQPPKPGTPLENGTFEEMQGVTIADGVVYLGTRWRADERQEWRYYIDALNLSKENWRRVYSGLGNTGDIGVTGNILVSNNFVPPDMERVGLTAWLNLSDPTAGFKLASSSGPTGSSVTPQHDHSTEWIVMTEWDPERRPNPWTLRAYSIPNEEGRLIMESLALTAEQRAVNDEYFVIGGYRRTDVWETQGLEPDAWNVYWMPIEELERRWQNAGS